ncbi:hypothetical protein Ae717Ps2_2246 [Pseudonocardia sp. Ae717_Ps2]|nr:hypothetical protein Ae717Ps2_2246 [Pseudonocardia sp. Ae717_Ps2]
MPPGRPARPARRSRRRARYGGPPQAPIGSPVAVTNRSTSRATAGTCSASQGSQVPASPPGTGGAGARCGADPGPVRNSVSRRAAASASAPSPDTAIRAARCGRESRVVAQASSRPGPSRGSSSSHWVASSRTPYGVRADSVSTWGPVPARGGTGGAPVTTAWTFVPPKPNALSPAPRTVAAGHVSAAPVSRSGPPSICRRGLGCSTCRPGTISSASAQSRPASPARPAAECRCPIRLLSEPSATEPGAIPCRVNTSERARTSIGSPIAVPVPCVSTIWTVSGSTRR